MLGAGFSLGLDRRLLRLLWPFSLVRISTGEPFPRHKLLLLYGSPKVTPGAMSIPSWKDWIITAILPWVPKVAFKMARLLIHTQSAPPNTRQPMRRLLNLSSKLDKPLACPFLNIRRKPQNFIFTCFPWWVIYSWTGSQLLTPRENISTMRSMLSSTQTR